MTLGDDDDPPSSAIRHDTYVVTAVYTVALWVTEQYQTNDDAAKVVVPRVCTTCAPIIFTTKRSPPKC